MAAIVALLDLNFLGEHFKDARCTRMAMVLLTHIAG
jgi:hypothetical protein